MDERKVITTIKKVLPAVVSITISKHLEDLERELSSGPYPFLSGRPPKAKHKRRLSIPNLLVDSKGMVNVGGGSGFIVGRDGLILTNKHVVGDPSARYTVITDDDRKHIARVVSRDPINDVAILEIGGHNLPTVALGDATKLELGETVIAIGNALGLFKNTVSTGIISGLSRSITAESDGAARTQELRGLIQTDAAINPGNSGGPLVDLAGRAIGVNAAVAFEAESIGFAIPINAARRDLADIKKYGRIRRPYLGVRYITLDENLKAKRHLPVGYGALVTPESAHDRGVVPKSPAGRGGIREGDIILECNGEKIRIDHPIQDILENLNVNDKLRLLVLRGRRRFTTTIALAERK